MRWPAPIKKWPDPLAGSHTFRSSSAFSGSGSFTASSRTGSRAESRSELTRLARLALVSGGDLEGERGGVGVQTRMHLEERFVDASELLRAKVAVIDRTTCVSIDGERKLADHTEQVAVSKLGGIELGCGLIGEEEAPQGGKGKLSAAGAQLFEHQPQTSPQVGVAPTAQVLRETAEPLGRVVVEIDLAVVDRGGGIVEEIPILGDEQEEQSIDNAEELAVVALDGEWPVVPRFWGERGSPIQGPRSRSVHRCAVFPAP